MQPLARLIANLFARRLQSAVRVVSFTPDGHGLHLLDGGDTQHGQAIAHNLPDLRGEEKPCPVNAPFWGRMKRLSGRSLPRFQ
jgi:hypothetical protein